MGPRISKQAGLMWATDSQMDEQDYIMKEYVFPTVEIKTEG
jgi:hypothetical protein